MEKYLDINEDKLSIKCKLYCNNIQNIKRILVSCHGFGGSKENNASKRLSEEILPKYDDIGILTFDWPCHGKDVKSKLSLNDCDEYFSDDIYLNATSFGGYLSLKYLHEHECPFKKIILRCPAVTMHKVLSNSILTEDNKEKLNKGEKIEFGFDRKFYITKEFIDELKYYDVTQYNYEKYRDIMTIYHGSKDELVPIDDVRNFCINNGLDFHEVEGADHRFQEPSKISKFVKEGTTYLFDNVNDMEISL